MDFFRLLKWTGFPVNEAGRLFKEYKREAHDPAYLERQKWAALEYHYQANTSFRHFIGDWPASWEELPVLNKNLIREHGITRVPDQNAYPKYYHRATSGSTGKPFAYALDYLSHALTWRLLEDRYRSAGVGFNDLQARFFGFPLSRRSRITEGLKDRLSNRVRFNTIDLSESVLESWLDAFRRRPFVYIYGYAYPLVTFAHFLDKKGLVLKVLLPTLQTVIVTSEMCSLEEMALMERVYGVPVYNEYGASEAGIVGFGRNGRWKLSNELMLTEILDEQNRPCARGEVGKVVLTPLYNQGTPLIRYEIGDMAALEELDGQLWLTHLQGRVEEMAWLPSGKKVAGDTLFLYVFKAFSEHCKVVNEYKVLQTAAERFVVQVASERPLLAEEKDRLRRLCLQALDFAAELEIRNEAVLERTLMGKFKRFERKFDAL